MNYENVIASLLAHCNLHVSQLGLEEEFETFDFDRHASINDLPDQKHLIGVGEIGMNNATELFDVSCSFIVCTTVDDTKLTHLRKVIGVLFDKLTPGRTYIPMLDAKNGQKIGQLLVMDDVALLPMARSKGRPLQVISARFAATLTQP